MKNLAVNRREEGNLSDGWRSFSEEALDAPSLEALFANRIPVIRVKHFLSAEECEALASSIEAIGFENYESVTPPIGRIGVTQFEAARYGDQAKEWYFERARQAEARWLRVAQGSFDLVGRVRRLLEASARGSVEIATEKDHGKYFAGLVRRITQSALIHSDFAPFDAPDWSIGEIESQVSWNVYLKAPEIGGECIVYNRTWDKSRDDAKFRIPGSYGYRPEIVRDVEGKVIKQGVGDLVLFNSRCFHEVTLSAGERLTLSSFVGKHADGNLVLWS